MRNRHPQSSSSPANRNDNQDGNKKGHRNQRRRHRGGRNRNRNRHNSPRDTNVQEVAVETVKQPAPVGDPRDMPRKVGVLLINLGTPDGTGYFPMRRYLKEFLEDPRVIETNRIIWWFILNIIILAKRPFSSGHAYKSIWNEEKNESPLKTISRSQAEKVARELSSNKEIIVDWAMRYGNPTTKSKLDAMQSQGCDRILLFPLYPQYAAATTATACDKAFDALREMRWQPSIRVVPPYYQNADYIEVLADTVQDHIAELEWTPDVVLASFHGLPKSYIKAGDPYQQHCIKTTDLLRERLRWSDDKLLLTFQSRFGVEEWITPYTDKTLERLAGEGIKNVAVVCPGFSSDCVETLEEIEIEAAETFKKHGGEKFTLIPCLNDSLYSTRVLTSVIKKELQGWIG